MIRRKFYRDAKVDSLDKSYTYLVIRIAKEMGWTINYVLQMSVVCFNEVVKVINMINKEENEKYEVSSSSKTFGGLG